jgi:phage-related protein
VDESDAEGEQSHHIDAEVSQSANSDGRGASDMTLTKWLDMKLDKFEGSGTPMDAASWLRTMEKYMDALVMTPEDRVVYVAFQLKGLADVWWEGVRKAWTPAHGAPTWDIFVKEFTAKYYPTSFKEKMDVALRNIKQGNKTVDEHDVEFSKIVHFVDHINQNEAEKARRFFEGLNSEYRHVMGANRPNDYFTVVEQARGMELQIQLTEAEVARTRGTSTWHKRSHQEGAELTKHPAFKKSKPDQQP